MNVAFALLDEPRLPQPEAVVAAHRAIAPSGPALLADLSPDQNTVSFRLANGDGVMVGLMDAPVPGGEAESKAEYSLSTMGTGWKLPEHRAHLVVVLLSKEQGPPPNRLIAFTRRIGLNKTKRPPLDALIAFTRVVAAIVSASGSLGVYLGAAHATHDARFFVDLASTPEPLPTMLMLWNGVSVAKEDDRVSLLSLGMSQLELPNLLLTAPATDVNDALAYMFDLLAYVTSRGAALPEGDTIGGSADERIEIRYQPSPVVGDADVWRVDR